MKISSTVLILACASIAVYAESNPAHAQRGVAAAQTAKAETIKIATKGNDFAYDKTTLMAKPGQKIKLVFTNKSDKKMKLQHNWVLVKPGTSDTVGQAGLKAGPENGFVPSSSDVLAHTKLIDAGQSDTIEFTAPSQPGDYPYICTFPGHYIMMKGLLKVK
jgi:azurin